MSPQIKVLVVDDHLKAHKELFDSFLNAPDFSVKYCFTADDFVNAAIESYDVVLLDINLDLWKLTYEKALQIIGESAPIALTSTAFKESFTTKKLQEGRWSHPESKIIQVFDMRLLTIGVDKGEINKSSANTFSEILRALIQPKELLDKANNKEITLLHISDPQYGDPGTDDWSILLEQQIGDYLKENLYDPDIMVISGDIAFSGKKEEYEIAKVELRKLLEATSLQNNLNSLVLVPGNHDVDFRMSSVPSLDSSFDKTNNSVQVTQNSYIHGGNSVFGMALFRKFAYELTTDPKWILSENLSWVNDKLSHIGLRFIHLNTADQISTSNINVPSLDTITTNQISDELRKDNNFFTIAVSHHGPAEKDYANGDHLSEDWSRVSQLFKAGRVQMWLHGHGHARLTLVQSLLGKPSESKDLSEENNRPHRLQTNEVVRVMAPSSHLNSTKRAVGERRGFNIVKLKRLDDGTINKIEIIHFEVTDEGIKEVPDKTAQVVTRRNGSRYN
ncbi:hypothetical protein PspMM1_26550 [Pseudoalteromonas sp. MM1]|uniref:metallophosphoesterase n=1 Tax=Pseudoalteromonas sp. MM1 TaxID=3036714 RepID=UPI0025745438|nr:metallophosphoesterase [Pseudoalteromonas sp. MM1]BED90187.1 hypothetical protein PspMM1_26550 [Pseudoalteromonas sp. MM1]